MTPPPGSRRRVTFTRVTFVLAAPAERDLLSLDGWLGRRRPGAQ